MGKWHQTPFRPSCSVNTNLLQSCTNLRVIVWWIAIIVIIQNPSAPIAFLMTTLKIITFIFFVIAIIIQIQSFHWERYNNCNLKLKYTVNDLKDAHSQINASYLINTPLQPGDLWRHCGGLGKEILMPYPINQSWREQIELNWIGARVGLWDTALKFLSPGPRNDVTDHLEC